MLPPPTTMATSTPVAWASAISSATRFTVNGSMPYPTAGSAKASPDSLRSTRRAGSPMSAAFADRDPGELADADVLPHLRRQLSDQFTHRALEFLRVHELLVDEDVVLIELLDPALDEFGDHVLRLAFGRCLACGQVLFLLELFLVHVF